MLLLLLACAASPDRSTSTHSDSLPNAAAREAFLEDYVRFDRSYEQLAFTVDYRDNSGGLVPGPSDWDICVRAVVPAEELDAWTRGLSPAASPGEGCGLGPLPEGTAWFAGEGVRVGVHAESRTVHYRNTSR